MATATKKTAHRFEPTPDQVSRISAFIESPSNAPAMEMVRRTSLAALKSSAKKERANDLAKFIDYAIEELLAQIERGTKTVVGKFEGIEAIIAQVKSRNEKAKLKFPDDEYYLQTIGSSLLRNSGQNPNSVKKWLLANGRLVEEYNASLGLSRTVNEHNSWAGKTRKRLNIDLSELD